MPNKHTCPGCGAEYDPESGEAHFHEPDPSAGELEPEAAGELEPEAVEPEPVPAPAPRARNRFRRV